MQKTPALWGLVYYAATAVALAILVGWATVYVVENQDALVHSDAHGWIGAAAGALLGLWLARWKRSSAVAHLVMRIAGVLLVVLGVAGGFVMYAIERGKHYDGSFGYGLAIFVMVLLVASVVDCFILTFRAVAQASKLEWCNLEAAAEGVLERVDRVTRFTAITVSATLTVPAATDVDKARRLLEKAEKGCLITNSLAVDVHLDTAVTVAD